MVRTSAARAIALLLLAVVAFASFAQSLSREVQFDIAAQPLETAVIEFSKQAGIQILASGQRLNGVKSPGVKGRFGIADGLQRLLAGTGFTHKQTGDGTVSLIAPANAGEGSAAAAAASRQERILVTAQKRSELLVDVPVPVTAIDAGTLVDNNQLRLQEYFTRVPGLNFTSGNRGEPFVAIRGITTTPFANPTVGITVDDVPFGPTSLRGGGLIAPDFDPGDLARIEVLRGPQGTLYGVSSLGGLIKYVTVDPSTSQVHGRVQVGAVHVEGGHEVGYSVRGSLNVPLSDSLAVRASAHARVDPGYVDNPGTGSRDVNRGEASGGLFSARWTPSADFMLKATALFQDREVDGSHLVFRLPGLGDLQQSYVKGSGWYKTRYEAYSATVQGRLGSAELTSLTGYNVNKIADSVDTSGFFGALANARFGVTGAPISDDYRTEKLTQELRLSMTLGSRWDWLVGGFYTDEKARNVQEVTAVHPVTGAVMGAFGYFEYPTTYEEYAGFTNLTYRFSDNADIQVGMRQSRNEQTYSDKGPIFGGGAPTPTITITDDPFTYLVAPRYRLSPNLMAYARFASGYRAGGINSVRPDVPLGFKADTTQNYEVGLKGELGRALAFEAAVYYIDWKDIQLNYLSPTGVGYQTNGGRARSQGVELSMESRFSPGWMLAAWMAVNDAKLAENFPAGTAVRGFSGDRLPFSTRFAGNVSIDHEFPLAGLTWFVGASVSYVGERKGLFTASNVRETYPAYSQADARTGFKVGRWQGRLFVTNIADKRGLLGGGIGAINAASYVVIQPRTVGLSVSRSF